MKFAAAQVRATKGIIQANIENHKKLIELACFNGADTIIFPELSLTGYEPTLAQELAITQDDGRLNVFQTLCDANHITIGVGIPLKNTPRPTISMIIFQPHQPRQVYSKKYIHADEEPFFIHGRNTTNTLPNYPNIALAICYEISVPEHAEAAYNNKAEIYLASVVKSMGGIDKALGRLAEIARSYSMTVIMANSVGISDGELCAGKSSVWNDKGELLGQLNDTDEGILIFDTETGEIGSISQI